MQPPATEREFYTFIVGPKSSWTNGQDQRLRIRMPVRFVELTPEQLRHDHMEVGQFTFAVRFPSGIPVPHDQLSGRDVILLTAAWDPSDGVKRRVDGSWHNYYSRYSVRIDDANDMQQFKSSDSYDDSRLFVSVDKKTIVECKHILGKKLMPCHLMSNGGDHLTIEANFDRSMLGNWRDIVLFARKIISDVVQNRG